MHISDMLERRNKQQFILLFVLLSATISLYWFSQRDNDSDVDKNTFRNVDLKTIDEVSLVSKSGIVTLKYNGSRWKVNGEFNADPGMVDVLFATLQQAEPRRPLAVSLQDSVAKSLQDNGVKVSLISSGMVAKVFYAGGNTGKTQAFFLEENGPYPYLMTIPGYRVYVSGIFELGESGWRDKIVFGFNWRNFQRLEATFPDRPADNFVVAMDDNYFNVIGLTQVDTTKLNDFLDDVSLLSAEEYVSSDATLDSLRSVKPFVSILVTDIARNEYLLQLYTPAGQRRQIFGLINQKQWALFHEGKLGGVIRPRNFFGK